MRSGKKRTLSVFSGFGKKKSKCHALFFYEIVIFSVTTTVTIFLASVQHFIWLCGQLPGFWSFYNGFEVTKSHKVRYISP